jgi:hypothetical protein
MVPQAPIFAGEILDKTLQLFVVFLIDLLIY